MEDQEIELMKAKAKALEERVEESELDIVELRTRLDMASKQPREAELLLQIYGPYLEFMETHVVEMRSGCSELEEIISRIQLRNQKLKRPAHLPMDLMLEILLRLPAKSLLRCQSVCIYWLCLISSTKFKLMHLQKFNQLNPRSLFRRPNKVYSVHFDDEALTVDVGTHIEFRFKNTSFRIIGCCHGVVCLCDDIDRLILWNPSIRRELFLPDGCDPFNIEDEDPDVVSFSYAIFGFGYDKMSDDYKVVSLTYEGFLSPFARPYVEVYTVETGIWRTIGFPHDLPCFHIDFECPQVFFNGFVHWIADHVKDEVSVRYNSIMTFDISSEVFGQIQLPECLAKEFRMSLVVGVVGESLAVIYSDINKSQSDSCTYKIWAMKDYKKPESWTMIFNMRTPCSDLRKALRLQNKTKTMECRYGDLVIHDHNLSYFVDPKIDYNDHEYLLYVDKYQESLALLDIE